MLDSVTYGVTKNIQDDLSNDKEEDTEDNIAQRPTVLESANDENYLADEIDKEEDGVDEVGKDKDANGVLGIQAGPILESE